MSLDAATLALVTDELKTTLLDAKIDKIFEPHPRRGAGDAAHPHPKPTGAAAVGPQRFRPRLPDEGNL